MTRVRDHVRDRVESPSLHSLFLSFTSLLRISFLLSFDPFLHSSSDEYIVRNWKFAIQQIFPTKPKLCMYVALRVRCAAPSEGS
jgi:hypothetical protein